MKQNQWNKIVNYVVSQESKTNNIFLKIDGLHDAVTKSQTIKFGKESMKVDFDLANIEQLDHMFDVLKKGVSWIKSNGVVGAEANELIRTQAIDNAVNAYCIPESAELEVKKTDIQSQEVSKEEMSLSPC